MKNITHDIYNVSDNEVWLSVLSGTARTVRVALQERIEGPVYVATNQQVRVENFLHLDWGFI